MLRVRNGAEVGPGAGQSQGDLPCKHRGQVPGSPGTGSSELKPLDGKGTGQTSKRSGDSAAPKGGGKVVFLLYLS